MSDLRLLLDAPGEAKQRIQIATLGDYKHSKYGEFSITAENVENWQRNLSHLPGGRALIDLDHRADRSPRNSEAAGWITHIDMTDGVPMADVEWSTLGEDAIKSKRFLFFSPTYGKHKDEHGNVYEDTLIGGALTNRPFLSKLPTVSLATPERVSEAYEELYELGVPQAERDLAVKEGNALPDGSYPIRNTAQLHSAAILAASGHGNVQGARALIKRRAKELGVDLASLPGFAADSPAKKMDTAILTALELEADADDTKVLEAIETLKELATKPPEPEPTKTLEQLAQEQGKTIVDSKRLDVLIADATAGREAKDELVEQKFTVAWTRALEAGRAIPAQEESRRKYYTLDAETTLKELDEGPVIVNVKASGWSNQVDDDYVPPGVDPASHQLDKEVKAKLTELGKPMTEYPKVLEQMLKGEI